MSKVFVTGDTHGEMSISRLSAKNWPLGKTLTKEDYVIVLGDFGFLWNNVSNKSERYWIEWLTEKPWITLFLDGNHENHYRLQQLLVIPFNGGLAGKVSDSVFHLRRGEIYTLGKSVFFAMGGALSIDKSTRTEYISWWKGEIPSYKEFANGLDNLELYQYNIDYILTHTCPITIANVLTGGDTSYSANDPTTKYFEQLANLVTFKHWYFGHWHEDRDISKYSALYHRILEIL